MNRELADRFLPQFAKGLAIGTAIVVALVFMAFRDWRLSLLSLAPTAVGIVWAAGALALAGIALDLFALFAVVTLVGIGVDYGVHVVHRYRERRDRARRSRSSRRSSSLRPRSRSLVTARSSRPAILRCAPSAWCLR